LQRLANENCNPLEFRWKFPLASLIAHSLTAIISLSSLFPNLRDMYRLNLPQFEYKLKKADGKVWIFDGIRKKFIVLTPEEWVRQHFVNYLIAEKKYPRSLIRVEGGLVYNQLAKRTDIVVFDRQGKPWMVVECKSPALQVSPATLSQASVYNATLQAQFLAVSNGLTHLCARIDWQERSTTLLEDTPPFPDT
jgi:hypothetical protein